MFLWRHLRENINSFCYNHTKIFQTVAPRKTMATSVLRSPVRSCPIDRCDLSPAKRIAIGPSQNNLRPSKCTSVEVVDIEISTTSLPTVEQSQESLVSLLRDVPQKKITPNLERYQMYSTLVEVYSALSNGESLPAHTAEILGDRSTKRRVYQFLFEVMRRKYLHISAY